MINLALIGIGDWGNNYLSTIKTFPDCRIKYVCSQTPKKLNQLDSSYIKVLNYKDLFKFKDISGVIIATPGSTHYQIAKEFLKRNYNLLIEKPLTISYEDSLKLKSLKDKLSAKVLVGHIYLFDPAYKEVKKIVKSIGSIQYTSFEGLNNGPFRKDISALWDWGPHAISLFLDIYEKDPILISAWELKKLRPHTQLSDLCYINLKFADQSQAFAKIGWLFPVKRRELVIVGSKSSIIYSDLYPRKITLYDNIGPKLNGKTIVKNQPMIRYPEYSSKPSLNMEIREFIDAIYKNRDIKKSDLDFGVKVTKLLSLAEQSIRDNGKLINVN